MNAKINIFEIFFLFLILIGCEEREVIITADYVINPNWDEINNTIRIVKMNLKDSTDNINLENVSSQDLLKKLSADTNYSYVANVQYNGESYTKRKVYFERYNGFLWRRPPDLEPNRKLGYNNIKKMELDSWYLIFGLSNVKTLYYVHINPFGRLYCFKVPASAWTNY
jgi:hypothetical protein